MSVAKGHRRRVQFALLHRAAAGVGLLAFGVIVAAGIMAGASVYTMAFRAAVAVLVIGLVSRVVVSILAAYEEMNSGKA